MPTCASPDFDPPLGARVRVGDPDAPDGAVPVAPPKSARPVIPGGE